MTPKHSIKAVVKALKKAGKEICKNKQQKIASKVYIEHFALVTQYEDSKDIMAIAEELWGLLVQYEDDQEKKPPYGLPSKETLLTDTSELKLQRHKLHKQLANSEPPPLFEEAVPSPIAAIVSRIPKERASKFTDDQLEDTLTQFKRFVSRSKDELKQSLIKPLDEISRLKSRLDQLDTVRFQAFKTAADNGESGWLEILEVNEGEIMELTRLRTLKAQCEKDIEALSGPLFPD